MKSPSQHKIIQIDITNACFNKCSNCTRFCGNHKKPFFMDYVTFQKACESLYDFPGMVGIIGGEPTLHPDFDRMIRYYDNVFPRGQGMKENPSEPITDICGHRNVTWADVAGHKKGLWTSFGPGYAKHFELIRNVFEYQCVNDHKNAGQHQALMITRKELGISDEQFKRLRDECWLQNLWSSAITPKGAFFCEVAAAMDMLLDGPGGWPIERGWWKRKPEDFGDQLKWCEKCSACLGVPSATSHDDTDIVSPEWDKVLTEMGSKKKRHVFQPSEYHPSKYPRNTQNPEPYLVNRDSAQRLAQDTSQPLAVGKINMVMVCINYSDKLNMTLQHNKRQTDRILVVTDKQDVGTQEVCKKNGVEFLISEKKNQGGAAFNKGAMLNEGINYLLKDKTSPWILLSDADIILPEGFKDICSKFILDPGTLYFAERVHIEAQEIRKFIDSPNLRSLRIVDPTTNRRAWGYFQLFSVNSSALENRKEGEWYSEEYYSAGYVDKEFRNLWPKEKRYFLNFRCIHIAHGERGVNWEGINDEPKS